MKKELEKCENEKKWKKVRKIWSLRREKERNYENEGWRMSGPKNESEGKWGKQ